MKKWVLWYFHQYTPLFTLPQLRVSLYSPGGPGTFFVDQCGLELETTVLQQTCVLPHPVYIYFNISSPDALLQLPFFLSPFLFSFCVFWTIWTKYVGHSMIITPFICQLLKIIMLYKHEVRGVYRYSFYLQSVFQIVKWPIKSLAALSPSAQNLIQALVYRKTWMLDFVYPLSDSGPASLARPNGNDVCHSQRIQHPLVLVSSSICTGEPLPISPNNYYFLTVTNRQPVGRSTPCQTSSGLTSVDEPCLKPSWLWWSRWWIVSVVCCHGCVAPTVKRFPPHFCFTHHR